MATGLNAVLNEIETIKTNVSRSFDAVSALGGSVPQVRALSALPGAIQSLNESPIGKVQNSGVIKMILNSSQTAFIPPQALMNKLLDGAKVYVYTPQAIYTQDIPSLAANTQFNINIIPSPLIPSARIRIVLGEQTEEIVAFDEIAVTPTVGGVVEARMNLSRYAGDGGDFYEIGRVQRLDQSTSSSYLIARKYVDGVFTSEKFGWYKNEAVGDPTFPNNWVNDTGIFTFIPEMDPTTGLQTNENPHPTMLYWERDIFPFNQAKKVRMHTSVGIGSGKTANADLYFSEIPIYYVKNEIRTLKFETKNAAGDVLSSVDAPCRIWWLSKNRLPGYELPSWEKKWIYVDNGTVGDQHNYTKTSVAKAANYYACYKSVTKTCDNGDLIQSYPYAAMVSGLSRGSMCDQAKKLNAAPVKIYGSGVFPDGTELPADTTNRRFYGNTWLEFQAFRYLMYIQFGTDIQATLLGITANNGASIEKCWQNSCEVAYEASPNVPTFSVGAANESNPISWLWIVNPHGSEGDQMADATTFAERIDAGTQTTMLAMLDRALVSPHGTNKQTMLNNGYDQLTYKWTAVGKSGQSKRGLDSRPEFWAYQFPAHNDETAAIELGASGQVDSQFLSGHPAAGTLGEVARVCSLSNLGSHGRALGPWCVSSSSEPSHSGAPYWGARVSCVLSADEAEGVVG